MPDRAYFNKRREDRRKKLRDLLGGKCVRCGTKHDLQFDHINPKTKKFRIADKIDAPEDVLMAEVNKCALLCKKCHKEKTLENWEVGQPKSRHGTLWMYKKYKCRCYKCKKAMSNYNKNRRFKKIKEIYDSIIE